MEIIRGTVQRSSASGVLLAERLSWLTYSKFAKAGAIPTLEGGDKVELSIDNKGFIRTAVIENMPSSPEEHETESPTAPAPAARPTRDTVSTRVLVLTAAARFGASRPELKSSDVLAVAESWESWVLR
jgi:hypothetical protein